MKILIEKDVLEQTLDENKKNERHLTVAETRYWCEQYKLLAEKAIIALREALAEQDSGSVCAICGGIVYDPVIEQACPNGCDTSNGRCVDCPDPVAEQAEQEPVAWADDYGAVIPHSHKLFQPELLNEYTRPLYAAPVRTKDLTDSEITNAWERMGRGLGKYTEFARAVIAADREKNK